MKKCPNNCASGTFHTTAVEMHDWLVDGNGEFIQDLGCSEIYAEPDSGNVWTCAECGSDAIEGGE